MTRVQHRLLSSMRVAVLLLLLCFVTQAQGTTTTEDPTAAEVTTETSTAESATNSSATPSAGENTTEATTDATTTSSSNSTMDTTAGDSGGMTGTVNETTTLPPSSSPTPTMGDNSSSTANSSSEVTSPEANTTTASNDTTSASIDTTSSSTPTSSTPIPTTPTPTTPAPPTTEPSPHGNMPANLDAAMHMLQLDIGESNDITSSCNISVTTDEVHMAFQNVPGFLFVTSTSMRSKMAVTVYFRSHILLGDSANTENATKDALMMLNSTSCLNVTSDYVTRTSEAFAQRAMKACEAGKVCPVGYTCEASGNMATCKHMCRDFDCGHGYCNLNLTGPMVATRVCSCKEEGMYVYRGEKCDTPFHRPDVVIAIVAGVLGSLCFIFLLIIICMCVQRARDNAHKYEMNGHFNEGYTGHSLSKM